MQEQSNWDFDTFFKHREIDNLIIQKGDFETVSFFFFSIFPNPNPIFLLSHFLTLEINIVTLPLVFK